MTFEDLAVDYSESGVSVLSLLGKRQITLTTVQAGFIRAAVLKYLGKVTESVSGSNYSSSLFLPTFFKSSRSNVVPFKCDLMLTASVLSGMPLVAPSEMRKKSACIATV
jgi:hypothetical protein